MGDVMARPKDIGTAAETAVVRALRGLGFPAAERRALAGAHDLGDVTGTPGVVWEVKGGEAAKSASDGQIAAWMAETETERVNASANIGVLVVQRRAVGPANAHRWRVHLPMWQVAELANGHALTDANTADLPVSMLLGDVCTLLRVAGYSQPLPEWKVAAR
jgi:hypothetical protein